LFNYDLTVGKSILYDYSSLPWIIHMKCLSNILVATPIYHMIYEHRAFRATQFTSAGFVPLIHLLSGILINFYTIQRQILAFRFTSMSNFPGKTYFTNITMKRSANGAAL